MSTAVASLAAERQRRHRERMRAGRIPLTVEIDNHAVEALIVTGAVTETDALSRQKLGEALSEMIDDWSTRALAAVTA